MDERLFSIQKDLVQVLLTFSVKETTNFKIKEMTRCDS